MIPINLTNIVLHKLLQRHKCNKLLKPYIEKIKEQYQVRKQAWLNPI